MNFSENRLDASLLDSDELNRLAELVIREERPALVEREGVRIDLPDPIFHLLVRVIRMMKEGQAIVLMPEEETFTTQAAANFLGVSRQFVVNLLEKKEIPFHKVGVHRRVYFKDLLAYRKRRDEQRRSSLNKLFHEVDKAGVYDAQLLRDHES
jgi:excisionase family DNA binding protein